MRILHESDARPRPWKNGRGITQELAIWPDGASLERADFAYRISRAGIAEDGPFSEFLGCDRVLIVLDGDGIELRHGGVDALHVLPARIPYAFSGDDKTEARLLGGPVRDFNVIVARERVRRVSCEVVTQRASLATVGNHLFCHVVSGEFGVESAGTLKPFESAWWNGRDIPKSVHFEPLAPDALAIVVCLEARLA